MLLSELFDYLSYGELSQHSIGSDDSGAIGPKDFPKVVSYVNQALTALHGRLLLRSEQLLVQTRASKDRYELSTSFTQSNKPSIDDGVFRYILDEHRPFQDDLMVIESIVREDGTEFDINDDSVDDAVFIPNYNTIQLSEPADQTIAVLYRANHPRIKVSRKIDPESIEVNVPDFCLEALMFYIGYRLLSSATDPNNKSTSQAYLSSFLMEIENIKSNGLLHTQSTANNHFRRREWV